MSDVGSKPPTRLRAPAVNGSTFGPPLQVADISAFLLNNDTAALAVVPVFEGGGGTFGLVPLMLADNVDDVAPIDQDRYLGTVARLTALNGNGNFSRLRMADGQGKSAQEAAQSLLVALPGDATALDVSDPGVAAAATLGGDPAAFLVATSITATIAGPGTESWTENAAPAVGVRASVTRAAGGAGVRHVCTSIAGAFQNLVGAVESGELVLRDGATGAGTVLWRCRWINGVSPVFPSDFKITGSENTAMTLEFVAAPTNAGNTQSVSMTGYELSTTPGLRVRLSTSGGTSLWIGLLAAAEDGGAGVLALSGLNITSGLGDDLILEFLDTPASTQRTSVTLTGHFATNP